MDVHHQASKENIRAKIQYPPGYRFMPTDSELIMEYLLKKIKNEPIPIAEISETYLKLANPKHLTEKYPKIGDNEWYFFTPRDRKYPNGKRPDRGSESGYWKATGADKQVVFEGKVVGFRKALVFYEGKPQKGQKTNWIMHEFRVNGRERKKKTAKDMRLDDWVLCRIYEKCSRVTNRQLNRNAKNCDIANEEAPIRQDVQVSMHDLQVSMHDVQVSSAAAVDDEVVNKYEDFPVPENHYSCHYHHEPVMINNNNFIRDWYNEDQLPIPTTFDSSLSIEDPAIVNDHLHSYNYNYGMANTYAYEEAVGYNKQANGGWSNEEAIGFKQANAVANGAWSNESFASWPPNNTNCNFI